MPKTPKVKRTEIQKLAIQAIANTQKKVFETLDGLKPRLFMISGDMVGVAMGDKPSAERTHGMLIGNPAEFESKLGNPTGTIRLSSGKFPSWDLDEGIRIYAGELSGKVLSAEGVLDRLDIPSSRVGILIDPNRPLAGGVLIDRRRVSWLSSHETVTTTARRINAAVEEGIYVDSILQAAAKASTKGGLITIFQGRVILRSESGVGGAELVLRGQEYLLLSPEGEQPTGITAATFNTGITPEAVKTTA